MNISRPAIVIALLVFVVGFFQLQLQRRPPAVPPAVEPLPPPAAVPSTRAAPRITPLPSPTSMVATPLQTPRSDAPNVQFEIKEGYAVSFGDTLLGKPLHDMAAGSRGMFRLERPTLWPTADIAYNIHKDIPNAQRIHQVLDYLQQNTPLHFHEMLSGNEDGLVFERSPQLCASYMGRVGGPQPILVADSCPWTSVLHEMLHAFGFPHEHSRLDRDRYVEVQTANIQPGFELQFEIVPLPVAEVLERTGFDFHSIMLYSTHAFAKDARLETLKSLVPNEIIAPTTTGLSPVDLERVRALFEGR